MSLSMNISRSYQRSHHHKNLISLVLAGCLMTACKTTSTQHLPAKSITIDQVERIYHLFVPRHSPGTPMPLLIAFHGGGGAGEAFPQQAQFEALAEEEGFMIAFPQGDLAPGNEGEWQLNTRPNERHDIKFIEMLIKEISERHALDAKRIYATGYSLGSMFIYEVACQLSDRFAAVASHAGTMPKSPADCNPQRHLPIMHLHGADDSLIAYGKRWDWKAWDEVGTMRDVPSLIEYWRVLYQCQTTTHTESASSKHSVYTDCKRGGRVEHHRIHNVGHEWPRRVRGVSTHRVIWNFVSDFTNDPPPLSTTPLRPMRSSSEPVRSNPD